MEKEKVQNEGASVSRIKAQFIIAEDILMRGLIWGTVVLAIMGGTAYGIIWFVLHVIKPFVNHG